MNGGAGGEIRAYNLMHKMADMQNLLDLIVFAEINNTN
jgi:hypothetical protein